MPGLLVSDPSVPVCPAAASGWLGAVEAGYGCDAQPDCLRSSPTGAGAATATHYRAPKQEPLPRSPAPKRADTHIVRCAPTDGAPPSVLAWRGAWRTHAGWTTC